MQKTIHVRVPGTSANCGAGFDTLGLACTIYNDLTLTLTDRPGVQISIEGEGADFIPKDERNIVWKSVRYLLDKAGDTTFKGGILRMENHVPLSRGLGSSAAAIVAGLKAANTIIGNSYNRHELLELATAIEGHPDNVAPAVFGGFTVSLMNKERVECYAFMPKNNMKYVVAVPNFPLPTRKARAVLPQQVSREDAIFNIGRASMLVACLCRGNERMLPYALDDRLHQPYRASLIPGMEDVFAAANKAGAYGACLSGAGPCLLAFTPNDDDLAHRVGESMRVTFANHCVRSRVLVLDLDRRGAHIINHE